MRGNPIRFICTHLEKSGKLEIILKWLDVRDEVEVTSKNLKVEALKNYTMTSDYS